MILKTVAENGGTIIDINPEVTWFSDYAMISGGYHPEGPKRCFLAKANETCRVSKHALSCLKECFSLLASAS